jgi:hypothetical protein
MQARVLAELRLELYLAPVRDSRVERRLVQSLAAAQARASVSARYPEWVELVGLCCGFSFLENEQGMQKRQRAVSVSCLGF